MLWVLSEPAIKQNYYTSHSTFYLGHYRSRYVLNNVIYWKGHQTFQTFPLCLTYKQRTVSWYYVLSLRSLKRSIVGLPVQLNGPIHTPPSNIHLKHRRSVETPHYCTRTPFKSQLNDICNGKKTAVSINVLLITTYGTDTLSSTILCKRKEPSELFILKKTCFLNSLLMSCTSLKVKLYFCDNRISFRHVHSCIREARWPSGRALDSRARGQGFDRHSIRRVVSLSKIHLPPKKYW